MIAEFFVFRLFVLIYLGQFYSSLGVRIMSAVGKEEYIWKNQRSF